MAQRWTPREVKFAVKARINGATSADIASALGRSTVGTKEKLAEIPEARVPARAKSAYWTPEEDELLRKLVMESWSARRIGEHLGRSRNSVIGRSYRLKLERKEDERPIRGIPPERKLAVRLPAVKSWTPSHFYAPRPQRTTVHKPVIQAIGCYTYPRPPHFKGVAFDDLELSSCRYPYENSRGTTVYCGQRRKPGSSYCPGCHAICWKDKTD